MTPELVTVATFTDLTRAQGARAALEGSGIESFLLDELTGSIDWGLMPALGGLRLQVAAEDAELARELLASSEPEGEPEDESEGDGIGVAEETAHRKRVVAWVSLAIVFLPVLLALVLRLLG